MESAWLVAIGFTLNKVVALGKVVRRARYAYNCQAVSVIKAVLKEVRLGDIIIRYEFAR